MSNFDFDTLLDKSIDDLKDLPEYKVPHTGMYKLSVTMTAKEVNNKPALSADFKVRELVELADSTIPEEDRAKEGDGFNMLYVLKNEEGEDLEISWGRLKELLKPFEAHFGTKNLKELVTQHLSTPVDITAKVTRKERKDDKGEVRIDARVTDIAVD